MDLFRDWAAYPQDAPANLIEPLRRRRSIRAFSSREVAQETLATLLDAARWSASCYGEEPWRYIITRRGDDAHARLLATLMEANRAWAQHAPVLALTLARRSFTHNGQPNAYAAHDAGIALGALAAQAAALGVAVHPMAGYDRELARAAFNIGDEYELLVAVAIGYPGDAAQLSDSARAGEYAPRVRRPLAEIVLQGWPGSR
jgi:nitroreductase